MLHVPAVVWLAQFMFTLVYDSFHSDNGYGSNRWWLWCIHVRINISGNHVYFEPQSAQKLELEIVVEFDFGLETTICSPLVKFLPDIYGWLLWADATTPTPTPTTAVWDCYAVISYPNVHNIECIKAIQRQTGTFMVNRLYS